MGETEIGDRCHKSRFFDSSPLCISTPSCAQVFFTSLRVASLQKSVPLLCYPARKSKKPFFSFLDPITLQKKCPLSIGRRCDIRYVCRWLTENTSNPSKNAMQIEPVWVTSGGPSTVISVCFLSNLAAIHIPLIPRQSSFTRCRWMRHPEKGVREKESC